eukprot:g39001.t1
MRWDSHSHSSQVQRIWTLPASIIMGVDTSRHAGRQKGQEPFEKWELDILRSCYKDLCTRGSDGADGQMDKETFLKFFFNAPGLVGERLFACFDPTRTGFISEKEFIDGLGEFARGTTQGKIQFAFNLFDLSGQGLVSRTDLESVLSSMMFAAESYDSYETGDDGTLAQLQAAAMQGWTPQEQEHAPVTVTNEDLGFSEMRLCEQRDLELRRQIKTLVDAAFADPTLIQKAGAASPAGAQRIDLYAFSKWLEENPKVVEVIELCFVDKRSERVDADGNPLPELNNHFSMFKLISPLSKRASPPDARTSITARRVRKAQNKNELDKSQSDTKAAVERDLLTLEMDIKRSRARGLPLKCPNCHISVRVQYCFRCGKMLQENSLACLFCTVPPFNGAMNHCFVCGFDLRLSDPNAEPAFRSWERLSAVGTIRKAGHLTKVGQRLGQSSTKWYELRDNYLYVYKKQGDYQPQHSIFLDGCFIEGLTEKGSKHKYGIEIILQENPRRSRILYCSSSEERNEWLYAMRKHANMHSLEDYYIVGKELGVGQYSSVHLAKSIETKQEYAVKIIDKGHLTARERRALATEVAVLKMVRHPHIIRLRNYFESRRKIHIVMSLVSGGDLFDTLERRKKVKKRFTEDEARRLIARLLSVVQYLHVRGIVHRDLKPENIMVRTQADDTDIVIGDFGLAKFASPTEKMKMSCGTLAYVAPEVLQKKGYGLQVDIWSVGVIMFLVLRGKLPFNSKDESEIIAKTIEGKITFDDGWKAISPEAKDLLHNLLKVDPNDRFTAAQALRHSWFPKSFRPPNQLPPTPRFSRAQSGQSATTTPNAGHQRGSSGLERTNSGLQHQRANSGHTQSSFTAPFPINNGSNRNLLRASSGDNSSDTEGKMNVTSTPSSKARSDSEESPAYMIRRPRLRSDADKEPRSDNNGQEKAQEESGEKAAGSKSDLVAQATAALARVERDMDTSGARGASTSMSSSSSLFTAPESPEASSPRRFSEPRSTEDEGFIPSPAKIISQSTSNLNNY